MCPIWAGGPKKNLDGCKRPRKFNVDRQRAFPINLQLLNIAKFGVINLSKVLRLVWLTLRALARMVIFEHTGQNWEINGA